VLRKGTTVHFFFFQFGNSKRRLQNPLVLIFLSSYIYKMMELKHVIVGLAVAFASYFVVDWMRTKDGVQEPPKVQTTIPFIGHIIGFAIYGVRYFGRAWYV
jgi:hypothetical protein